MAMGVPILLSWRRLGLGAVALALALALAAIALLAPFAPRAMAQSPPSSVDSVSLTRAEWDGRRRLGRRLGRD